MLMMKQKLRMNSVKNMAILLMERVSSNYMRHYWMQKMR